MRKGFSARNLLLLGIAAVLASPALAEELPNPRPVESKNIQLEVDALQDQAGVVQVEAEEWIPLPVPRPLRKEIAETEPGSGRIAFTTAGEPRGGDVIVTSTTTARSADPDDPDVLRRLVAEQAELNGIPAALGNAVVTVESSYNPKAKGSAGEIGLMQIKPETARLAGFRGPDSALYHPATNLRWGMKYLAEAQRKSGGTICGTILRYNAGHGAEAMNPISAAYCEKVKALLRGENA